MHDPAWLQDIPKSKQQTARARFTLKLAALYYSEEGHMKNLSLAAGYAENTLGVTQAITPEMAIKLEEVLGRTHFPREFFRPDIFLVAG